MCSLNPYAGYPFRSGSVSIGHVRSFVNILFDGMQSKCLRATRQNIECRRDKMLNEEETNE